MNCFYKTITTVTDNSNISLYMIPVILGIVVSVLLMSYYILSKQEITAISGDISLLIHYNIFTI